MYLMNVPPVAATQTEWRACGPPGGYSLPICFNDSDTELSTRAAPISDKVQMIIESLRSSQSSLEMGDEIEGIVPPGQEGHSQVCKVAVGPYVGAKTKTKGPTENQQVDVSSPNNHASSDSDSDDSVDRGIEEAILEYLKEKDDHKRKGEPCFPFLQSSKIPRNSPPLPEVSKQNSDSNTFLIASSQFPKSVKAEAPTGPALIPLKKYIKNKAALNDNTVKKLDLSNSTTTSLVLPREQTKSPSKTISLLNKVKSPVTIKVEEDSNDSSSDDGIEEAIQRYQLEKKEQQSKREMFNPHALKEESDSTSDDGIEEAIRCYQLEQLKEKSALKPFLHKQKPLSKSLIHAVGSTSTENMKKHRLKKKKTRAEKEVKSVQPPPSVFTPKNTLSECSKSKGNGLLLFKVEGFKEQLTPAPPKVNTTAELMCAEAILDISKTVMPGAFHHGVGLSSCAPTESSMQSSLPENCPDEDSDGSSIDSEDGIEQEIRKFLEQKAQMHKQPPTAMTQEPQSANEPEKVKVRQVPTQKKPQRLSLTQKRKHKEENCSISRKAGTDNSVKETAPKPSPEHGQESSLLVFSQRSSAHLIAGLRNTEESGDKSSSLDSDEDLDTAIKDLLKTKKKLKKKNRDLKRKSRMCLKDEEPLQGNTLETKKLKHDPFSKRSSLKKVDKSKDDTKDKSGLNKKSFLQLKQTNKSKEHDIYEGETATVGQDTLLPHNTQTALEIKEDSSSVDSDDSIEQEIRRFLAEKAKAEKSKDGDVLRNGTIVVRTPLQDEDIKQENQLAEISRKSISPLSGQSPLRSQPLPTPQSLPPDICTIRAQSRLSSMQSCSPNLLEPADGAGAARTEQRRLSSGRSDVQDASPQTESVRPVLSPSIAHSRSESMKWRQSFGLPPTDTRTLSRTPFHITSSKISETPSTTPPYQSGGPNSQTPVAGWSSARTSKAPFHCSAETNVNTTFRSPVMNFLSTARPHPRMSFARSFAPSNRSQCPIEGEIESMVHISKDKSVFVELESNRTNHVQVRSRERIEGKERMDLLSEIKREGESMKIDDKEKHLERTEEEFIDEADCESDSRRNPEKKQGFSTVSLSSAIDPGITIRPCIALTTEERSRMFNRRFLPEKCKKGVPSHSSAPAQIRTLKHVKRKLKFVPVSRRDEARPHYHNIQG
ncbi:protein phosphatase 1 regulatory subunit 26 [Plectropomus leopardus]|uniref:protein phosphatase 1 regulatory subunit 26 n=1 Tax=Plectropomus leopardus TaxID=160734 RepID=UPI001C4D8A49|nr:protein phosphatase 1 regulatory subunit 26 [Plectropomus leopardus]